MVSNGSNGDGELSSDQVRALAAALNAQRALSAIEAGRLPELRSRRDTAFARALAVGVPAGEMARAAGLSAGRLSQMRRRFIEAGLL